jgi:hypothetical protein
MSSYQLNSSGQISLNGSQVLASTLHLSNPLGVIYGGCGSTTASGSRTALGLAIGSDIQAHNGYLDDISAASPTSGQVLSYNGSNFVASDAGSSYSADGSTLNLSGTTFSVATAGITATQLASGCVGTNQLASGAVTSSAIASGAVGNSALASNAVGSGNIASGALGTGLQVSGGQVEVNSNVVLTTGNYTLGGVIQYQSSVQYQKSGESGYAENDMYEYKSTDSSAHQLCTLAIPSNDAFYVSADIVCCSDDMAHYGAFSVAGLVINNAGTVSTGQLNSSNIYSSDVGLACALVVSSTNLEINVTGLASTNLRWTGKVRQLAVPKYA